jgi:hypothetical protein
MIAILPFLIFLEGSEMFGNFLKRRNIYAYWDVYHSALITLIILFIVLWSMGYR